MQLWKYAAVMAGALALGGCPGSSPNSPVTFTPQGEISDTRLYTTQECPSKSKPKLAGNEDRLGVSSIGLAASIASAVIPALIDVSLDALAGAIREAAKDKAESYGTQVATHLHRPTNAPPGDTEEAGKYNAGQETRTIPNAQLGCLVFIRGKFGHFSGDSSISQELRTFGPGASPSSPSNVFVFLSENKIALKTEGLKSYFEVRLEISPDFSAFRLVPNFAYIDRQLRNSEVLVSVSIYLPKGGRDLTPIAIATSPLDGLEDRKTLDFSGFPPLGSAWVAYPGLDAAATQAIARIEAARKSIRTDRTNDADNLIKDCKAELENLAPSPLPLGDPSDSTKRKCLELREQILRAAAAGWASEANGGNVAATAANLARTAWLRSTLSNISSTNATAFEQLRKLHIYLSPATIEFEVIESRKGSPFLKAVADILDKSKKGVGEALVASLSPAERAKRQADEEQRTRNSRAAVAAAQDLVKLRQAELDDLPATATRAARVKAENDLRQAKIAANNAYIADGRVPPYPEAQP